MALQISMPMFSEVPRLSAEDIERHYLSTWKDCKEFVSNPSDDGPLTFEIDGSLVAVLMIDQPIPWTDLSGPCETSVLWKNATKEVGEHKAHLIVTVMRNEELNPVQVSILLTQITSSILSTCEYSIGVYWPNATLVVPKLIFIDFSEQVLPKGPPVHIWVDFRVGPSEEDGSSGFTTGLAALGLMEIEAVNVPETVSGLKDRLTGIADYLISNGPVIKDGDTVGEDKDEFIRVVFGTSEFGIEGQVMLLRYEKTKQKKSRLKFW